MSERWADVSTAYACPTCKTTVEIRTEADKGGHYCTGNPERPHRAVLFVKVAR